jgi:diguanylate cyclase (GGDEF)-like protein
MLRGVSLQQLARTGKAQLTMDQLTRVADSGELMTREAEMDSRARASGTERHYGLVLVDLVGLRKINSDFDRATGNEVLMEMALRLLNLCPQTCVARVEADKFAVLFDGLNQDQVAVESHRLRHELNSASWEIRGKSVPVSVRVTSVAGPSLFPERTHLLWTAQRIHRERAKWKLRQRVQELENLARLNGLQAELDSFRSGLAISISLHDPLTGALNLRGLGEMQKSLNTPYALAFVDVDNLRLLNKSEGDNWEAGNRALVGVKRLLESISPKGIVARWGGDEFVLCLPGFTAMGARDELNSLLEHPEHQLRIGDLPVSFSGGVTTVIADDDHLPAMKRAQQCAQESKIAGRSRVILAE